MAPSHILQIFLRVTVQNQIGIAQRIVVDEVVQLYWEPVSALNSQVILCKEDGDKVSDTQRLEKSPRSAFRRKQKIRTLLLSEKSSDLVVVVHLQGLEPWAHWLRETNVQQSSISGITQIRHFYRFTVNLCFASAAFFAPVTPSCIRYPAVPVCKKCAKMCRAKINPLKQALSFYAKPGNRPGSSLKR